MTSLKDRNEFFERVKKESFNNKYEYDSITLDDLSDIIKDFVIERKRLVVGIE